MGDVTTIRMKAETKALLDDLKLFPRETYDDVVRRLAELAYDDEPLSRRKLLRWRRAGKISGPGGSSHSMKF